MLSRVFASFALALVAGTAAAVPERMSLNAADAVSRLRSNAGGALFLRASPKNAYTIAQATGSQPLMADNPALPPLERARVFLSLYGAALGITDPLSQLQAARISTDQKNQLHVHLDQVHEGLPVYGARVIVHMNASGITGVNGVFVRRLPSIDFHSMRPLAGLRSLALAESGKTHRGARLNVLSGRWVVYPEGLLRGQLVGSRLAYESLVVAAGRKPVRERVLVDATDGRVLDSINEVHAFLNREVYTPDQTTPPMYDESATTLATPKGPADPPLINDVGPHSATTSSRNARRAEDNLWIFDGGTYALYANMFGRKGYDACDLAGPCQPDQPAPDWSPLRGSDYTGQVQKTVYLINDNCPNAYWDGDATNYCPGFDGDDVVSHEWSHAYTQYTHNLIYAYQSGALNESWSDIFGESYDLLNGQEGPLGASLAENEYYEDGGSRWVVGEDLSEEAATLLLRDMWKPDDFCGPATCARNPGKATSENYSCGSGDGGGVHFNSSVPNHAFAMLVDGTKDQGPPGSTGAERDTYNGQSFMPGIGMVKALHIYFYAENNYQTPTTDFPQHANAVRMACQQLKGVSLKDPTGANSGLVISQADCDKLNQALLATEMDLSTPCPFLPVLQPGAPEICAGATDVFAENWESGGAGWTKTSTGVNAEWNDSGRATRDFVIKDNLPNSRPGHAAFGFDSTGGTCQAGSDYSGQFTYDSPKFTVPAGASTLKLRLNHYVATENTFDGGQVEISVNDGAFTPLPAAAFEFNPPGLLGDPAPVGNNTNPNAGEPAWTGTDINPPSGSPPGSWGTSVVNLAGIAKAGDRVQLRLTFSQDGCGGQEGWYVDELRLYSCASLTGPTLSTGADYENPDTNGSFTLSWTRPSGASGPDLLQQSTTSCGPLLSDDAENGLGNWTAASTANSTMWTTSNTKPQHGPDTTFFLQADKGDEAVDGGGATLTYKNAIAIPATGTTTLTFLEWYVNEEDDTGTVEVSPDGGANWEQVYKVNRHLDREVGAQALSTEALVERSVDLTSYAGKSIKLRFSFTYGDLIYFFEDPYGWYVDDVTITNDTWGDLLTTSGTSHTLSNQLDGTKCYRVRTAYPVNGSLISSLFSSVVNVTVQAGVANLAPVANAGPNQSVPEGTLVHLDGTASVEPNSDPLTYQWVKISGPDVVLTDDKTATPSFEAPAVDVPTDLRFRLTVKDPAGASSTATVTITVLDNTETPGNNKLGGALPLLSLLVMGAFALMRRRPR